MARWRRGALAYLIGRECRIAPDLVETPAAAARLAMRMIHQLVQGEAIEGDTAFTGPDGEALLIVPHGLWLHVERPG